MFVVVATLVLPAGGLAYAAPTSVVAQADPEDAETEGETRGDEGQSDPETETESGEEGSEPAQEESGPPWTYQMARIGLVLLAFLALSIGLAYYRFVASRRRAA